MSEAIPFFRSPELFKRYIDFVGLLTRPHLKEKLQVKPDVLWYYTTGATLIDIIKSGTIWSTQINCLNDQSELEYARELLRKAARRLRDQGEYSQEVLKLFEKIEEGLSEEAASTSEWFVLSLSNNRDDLSQWRAYGDNGVGYAIGLNSIELGQGLNRDRCFLLPVLYDRDKQNMLADSAAKGTVDFFVDSLKSRGATPLDEWIEGFLETWGEALMFAAPIVKHPSFHSEGEWRGIRQLRSEDFKRMKYQQRASTLSRHLPIILPAEDGKKFESLPITEIIVGPARNPRTSQVSVGDLLRTHGYGDNKIPVSISEIPLHSP